MDVIIETGGIVLHIALYFATMFFFELSQILHIRKRKFNTNCNANLSRALELSDWICEVLRPIEGLMSHRVNVECVLVSATFLIPHIWQSHFCYITDDLLPQPTRNDPKLSSLAKFPSRNPASSDKTLSFSPDKMSTLLVVGMLHVGMQPT